MGIQMKKIRQPAVLFLLAAVFLLGFLVLLTAQTRQSAKQYREDFNGDGAVGITDVISLMLQARARPDDPELDYNGDGRYSVSDAIELLVNIIRGRLTPLEVVVQPVEIDDFLLNPGRGFVSTGCFNDWIRQKARHPLCSVAQFRWYWDELEPAEGQIDFQLIDDLLAKAKVNGQKLNLRVMCQDGVPHVPRWVRTAGAKGMAYSDNKNNWQPFYYDPVFLEKHGNLIKALAARYDGHPEVDDVDIGSLGRWGEWHTSGTGMLMPSDSVRKKIIDMYLDNFTHTPLIMQIGGEWGLKYALSRGTGWRADCWGDMGGFSATWSHMKDFYQPALDDAGAGEAWEKGAVILETCWTMDYWYDQGWDIDYILSEALRWHVSMANNGSEDIPAPWWDKVVEFEKKMGYRFVLKRLAHPGAVSAGDTLRVSLEWENEGVAPIYLRHPLAFEFRNAVGSLSRVVVTDVDVTGWLPGPVSLETAVEVPGDLPVGEYSLGIAMLDPYYNIPKIKFAIQGRAGDGWYRLSRVTVK